MYLFNLRSVIDLQRICLLLGEKFHLNIHIRIAKQQTKKKRAMLIYMEKRKRNRTTTQPLPELTDR